VADELRVFSGNAHPSLASAVCSYLGIPLGKVEVFQFSNENIFVRILENIRGRDMFIIQPISSPVNQNLMELLIMLDAAKRASAGRITAVIPYYGYGRTDKKDQPRVPITARLVADLITVAGANRVLTVDLHAGQIQGFFNIPVDELSALSLLASYFKEKNLFDLVVTSADVGGVKRARDLSEKLGCPLAIIAKRRMGNADKTETLTLIGEVEGKNVVVVDDEIDTASSFLGVLDILRPHDVQDIYACCTHPIFSGPAVSRISQSGVKEVVVTDTVPIPQDKMLSQITVLSIASLLGEAIHRIHTGLSVGAMFE
jgi:ribose-phosphate pyrophosphokinase